MLCVNCGREIVYIEDPAGRYPELSYWSHPDTHMTHCHMHKADYTEMPMETRDTKAAPK